MTLALDDSTFLGALYGAVKRYPGKVKALAADMDMPESTLYAKLRGERGYPLDQDEVIEILNFLRSRKVEGWQKPVQVFCHHMDHLAVQIPRAMRESGGDDLKHVSEMMQEVADIAHELADATDEAKADGRHINSREWKRIEQACDEAMEKIAETRERYRARFMADKKRGLVK